MDIIYVITLFSLLICEVIFFVRIHRIIKDGNWKIAVVSVLAINLGGFFAGGYLIYYFLIYSNTYQPLELCRLWGTIALVTIFLLVE